jgi:hypothetical protein
MHHDGTTEIRMTNDQAPMTNEEACSTPLGHWDLVIGHSGRRARRAVVVN